MTSHTSSYTF